MTIGTRLLLVPGISTPRPHFLSTGTASDTEKRAGIKFKYIHHGFTQFKLPYTSPTTGSKMKGVFDQFTKVNLEARCIMR